MSGYKTLSKRMLQSLTVFEHVSLVKSIREISQLTGLSHGKVESILYHRNETAKEEMSLQSKVAIEYEKALFLLDYCLKRCQEIDSKATVQRVCLPAISTTLQILDSKNRLL